MTDQRSLIGMSEAQWQRKVTDAAVQLGWDWLHIGRVGKHQANGAKGTLGKGWPDLFLIKRGRIPLFVECKLNGEALKPDQVEVMRKLIDTGADYHVWRPSDFALVLDVLA